MKPDAMPDGDFLDFDFAAGQVYALGLTYADHIRETGERPVLPAVFIKHCQPLPASQSTIAAPSSDALTASIAHLDPALARWLHRQFGSSIPPLLDYEVEIGIALLEDISAQQLNDPAFQPALGYFVANDLTARSIQIAGEGAADKLRFWSEAKSFSSFLPTGSKVWRPADTNAGALPNLMLETRVNGEIRQSASTRHCLYTAWQMLRIAAHHAPDACLRRNDLILTGTPAGVAFSIPNWKRQLAQLLPRRVRIRAAIRASLDNPRFLQPGDRLQFSAGWLGSRELQVSTPI